MRITGLRAWPVTMRLEEPYTIAYDTFAAATNVFVAVATDGPITGYGCAAPDEHVTGERPDTVLAVLDYELPQGRVRASLQLLNTNGYLGSQERLLGDQGSLILSEARAQTEIYREQTALDWDRWVDLGLLKKPEEKGAGEAAGGRGTGVTESVRPPVYYLPDLPEEPPFAAHLANFFDAVRGGAALRCGPEAGFAAVVTVAKIMTAIETGAPVACTPEEWKA